MQAWWHCHIVNNQLHVSLKKSSTRIFVLADALCLRTSIISKCLRNTGHYPTSCVSALHHCAYLLAQVGAGAPDPQNVGNRFYFVGLWSTAKSFVNNNRRLWDENWNFMPGFTILPQLVHFPKNWNCEGYTQTKNMFCRWDTLLNDAVTVIYLCEKTCWVLALSHGNTTVK